MILQLQADQIVTFWPAIKETIVKSCPLNSDKIDVYLNHCLEVLLNGKHQCWLAYTLVEEEKKQLHGVLLTSLLKNKLFGYNSLSIDHMYAFTKWNAEIVSDIFNSFVAYANECSCDEIIADSNNVKAIDIAVSLGAMKETTKLCYKL